MKKVVIEDTNVDLHSPVIFALKLLFFIFKVHLESLISRTSSRHPLPLDHRESVNSTALFTRVVALPRPTRRAFYRGELGEY